jgi:hypothetical protein
VLYVTLYAARSSSSASSTRRCLQLEGTADNLKKSGAFVPGIRQRADRALHRQDHHAA